MLFGKTVAVYCENHMEHTNTICGQNAVFLLTSQWYVQYFPVLHFQYDSTQRNREPLSSLPPTHQPACLQRWHKTKLLYRRRNLVLQLDNGCKETLD
jgi:hypothetical protein